MPVLLKYAYSCSNGDYISNDWRDEDDGEPTQCRDNSSHTITANSIRVIGRLDPNESRIVEEYTPTGGNYSYDTVAFTAPANTTYEYEDSWDTNINVTSISYVTKDIHEGDEFYVLVGEDSDVGPIGADISAGATTVTVASSASMPYLVLGYKLKLSDGTNTDDVGWITAVDKATNTITFGTATTNAFAAGTPTKLLVTRVMVGRKAPIEIGPAWHYSVGKDKIGGSYLPKGKKVKIVYTNKSLTDAKRFIIDVFYLY